MSDRKNSSEQKNIPAASHSKEAANKIIDKTKGVAHARAEKIEKGEKKA